MMFGSMQKYNYFSDIVLLSFSFAEVYLAFFIFVLRENPLDFKQISSANRIFYFFLLILYIFYSLCFIAVVRIFSMMLNRISENSSILGFW